MCCQEILIDHIQCGMKVKVEIFEFKYHCFLSGANPVCLVELADWVQTITPNVYFNIYFWFRVVFVQCLPCVLVTIFNGYLLLALRRAHQVM